MKIGVTIPNNWGVEDPRQVLEFGPLAESLGYDSVWVMDHLFNTGYIRERLEDKPYYHPMSTLSFLAATTSKVTLGTSVLVLPYHNPVELAKYAATLDQISGGRVTLGVGVGAMTEEFDALGISMRQRGSLTDECIDIMKELWSSHLPKYQSKRWDFSDLYFSPKPVQPTIPVWVGGSSPGAMKRTALRGVGSWTVQWTLIRAVGRPDALTLGDLALRRVVSRLFMDGAEANDAQVEEIAQRWSPYRTYATVYLFSAQRTGAG